MSHQPNPNPPKRTVPEIRTSKGTGRLVMLTACTAPMARLIAPHCDLLLVGDSLGMVVYGLPTTLSVTLEMMIAHGAAVVRGAGTTPVIIDMPFGSYQASPEQAFTHAARVIAETGAAGVKLEGGLEMAETIRFLTQRGIPVMAHVGLMPQHVNHMGGFKTQGKDDASYVATLAAAKAVAEAGAFCLVVEGVVEPLAAEIARAVAIPAIGIGASAACDGQVLVIDDLLGMFERTPRFVRTYADLRTTITDAVTRYADDVRNGAFPSAEHCYGVATQYPKKTSKNN